MMTEEIVDAFVHTCQMDYAEGVIVLIERRFAIVTKPCPWWLTQQMWRWLIGRFIRLRVHPIECKGEDNNANDRHEQ